MKEDSEQTVWTADSWNRPTPLQREETLPLVGANGRLLLQRPPFKNSPVTSRGRQPERAVTLKDIKAAQKTQTTQLFLSPNHSS